MRLAFASLLITLFTLPATATPPTIDADASAGQTQTIRSLQLLAAIYRGDSASESYLSDADVAGIRSGIELGRLFYFRNTRAQLHLDITYLVIDAKMPDTTGPTYEHLEKDLRERGVADRQYDGIYVAGREAKGNWGGFHIFDGTGGAFGGVTRKPGAGIATSGSGDRVLHQVPFHSPDTWYYAAWNFVHEFQHALDLVIAKNSGRPDHLHAHPYADRNEPYFFWNHPNPHGGAQHWAWVGYTLRTFDNWMDVTGVTDSTLTFTDADGDGLPDEDARLPIDEKRFGSLPHQSDTDGDGLDDLAEFAADIYRGSDPRKSDTDGDGAPDGGDPHPTVALAPQIAHAAPGSAPEIDGQPDPAYAPLFTRVYHTNLPAFEDATVEAAWTDDGLYLFVHTSEKANLYLQIDGSPENGFWEGGDTYGVHIDASGGFRGEWGDKDLSKGKANWSDRGLEAFIPAKMGQGLSGEVNYGGPRRPEDDAAGLTFAPGNKLSLNLELSTGTPGNEGKALFTPNWSMFDTALAE